MIGGVEQVVAEQANRLRRLGHDVSVIAGRGDCQLVPELDSRFPAAEEVAARLAGGDDAGPQFAELSARLESRFRELLADREVVIVHNVLTMPFNLPAAAALVATAKPLIAWTHDHAWLNPRYRDFQRPLQPLQLMRRRQPRCLYVAISRARALELAELFDCPEGEIPVVPNGIDPDRFLGISPDTQGLLHRAGLTGRRPLLLAPVRVTRRKRLSLTLEVAAELRADHPGLGLVVSGPLGPHDAGNQKHWAELRAERSRLDLEGPAVFLHELGEGTAHPVGEQNISELYRLADLILLTSESEGFGLPLLEAALARAPIVCPEIPVLSEVAAGGAEFFAAGAGAAQIASACRRALSSRAARFRTGVLDRYSWAGVMESTERVIERATDG